MTIVIIFVILVIICLVFLVLPLWKKQTDFVNSNQTNVAIYKTQIEELEQDLKQKKINEKEFETAKEEIKNNLGFSLFFGLLSKKSQNTKKTKPFFTSTIITFAVVLISLTTYYYYGNVTYVNENAQKQATVEELIVLLKKKLKTTSENKVEGMVMLAQLYQKNNQNNLAIETYKRILKLEPKNSKIYVLLAYSLLIENKSKFNNETLKLLQKSLKFDAKNQDAIYLLATNYFQFGEFEKSINYWQKLLELMPKENHQEIKNNISTAKQKLSQQNSSNFRLKSNDQTNKVGLKISLQISSNLKVNLNDNIFVSVHTKKGPPMPLAAIRLKIKDLPKTFILDNTNAVIPNMNIWSFNQIYIRVRISENDKIINDSKDIVINGNIIKDKSKIQKIIIE